MQFINHSEGRIIPPIKSKWKQGEHWEYQYFLKDHLGNNRVLYTTKEETLTYRATFEEGTSASRTREREVADFPQINTSDGLLEIAKEKDKTPDSPDTPSTGHVFELSKTKGRIFQKKLAMSTGDKVTLKVYATYVDSPTKSIGLNSSVGLGSNTGTSNSGERSTADSGIGSSTLPIENDFNSSMDINAFAYIVGLDGQYRDYLTKASVTSDPNNPNWAEYTLTYTAQGNGDISVGIFNDSQNIVYIDDVFIEHVDKGARKVQQQDYYPFGMKFSSQEFRSHTDPKNILKNNWKYNGVEYNEELGGIYEMPFRGYDPSLGRFMQVDPLAELYKDWSPYVFAKDNPMYFSDPSGLSPESNLECPDCGNVIILEEVTITDSKWSAIDEFDFQIYSFYQRLNTSLNSGSGYTFYNTNGGGGPIGYIRDGLSKGTIEDPAEIIMDFGSDNIKKFGLTAARKIDKKLASKIIDVINQGRPDNTIKFIDKLIAILQSHPDIDSKRNLERIVSEAANNFSKLIPIEIYRKSPAAYYNLTNTNKSRWIDSAWVQPTEYWGIRQGELRQLGYRKFKFDIGPDSSTFLIPNALESVYQLDNYPD